LVYITHRRKEEESEGPDQGHKEKEPSTPPSVEPARLEGQSSEEEPPSLGRKPEHPGSWFGKGLKIKGEAALKKVPPGADPSKNGSLGEVARARQLTVWVKIPGASWYLSEIEIRIDATCF
jgi:hypothetical protein